MENNQGKTIGIIMTYNCSAYLEEIYNRVPKVLDEIIVVDDGSKDEAETARVAEKLGLTFFPHEHSGYGGNLQYGLTKALERGGDIMIEIHGDGQFDPSVIPAALEKMKEGYDFVLGSRFTDILQPLRDKMSLARYLANIGLSFLDRLILQVPLTEFHTGFRVYSRRLIEKISFEGTSKDYLYSFEIIAQAAYYKMKVGEIPIRCDYRKAHTSVSIWKATIYSFQTLRTLVQYILAKLGFKIALFKNETVIVKDLEPVV